MKAKKITLFLLMAMVLSLGLLMLSGHNEVSLSERRELTQWNDVWNSDISSGKLMSLAEDAAMDQFPFRDSMRTMKASYLYHVLGQLDNNGIYVSDGNAGRLDYTLNETSVNYAIRHIQNIQNTYLRGKRTHAYYCIVPDKNYYFAKELGYPVMDYDKMALMMKNSLDMENIQIQDLLETDSYYRTDPHWNQEKIIPAAQHLVEAMGGNFDLKGAQLLNSGTLSGAYLGQSALPLDPDPLNYWDEGALNGAFALDLTNKKRIPIYDVQGGQSDDPYNFFLGGAAPLQMIENPSCRNGRELIVFRDSFGSSIAPLLASSYQRVTLVDTRYIHSSLLKNYIHFQNQDVLFLYSALVLNQSNALK